MAVIISVMCLSGCSAESMSEIADSLGSLYDTYGPGQVLMSEDDAYYLYRRTMHHDAFKGEAYAELNNNVPFGGIDGIPNDVFNAETVLKRAGYGSVTVVSIKDPEVQPAGLLDPPGFEQGSYPGVTPQGSLYEKVQVIPDIFGGEWVLYNITTGTEYLKHNLDRCWDEVSEYMAGLSGENEGIYLRVTPVYSGTNDVCEGVLVEAESFGTSAVRFCRYYYNVQPGIRIDYLDGSNDLEAVPVPVEKKEVISDYGTDSEKEEG